MQTKRNGTETESKKEEGRNHIIIYGRKNPCRPMDGRDFFRPTPVRCPYRRP